MEKCNEIGGGIEEANEKGKRIEEIQDTIKERNKEMKEGISDK